jgi:hypothetical protein
MSNYSYSIDTKSQEYYFMSNYSHLMSNHGGMMNEHPESNHHSRSEAMPLTAISAFLADKLPLVVLKESV